MRGVYNQDKVAANRHATTAVCNLSFSAPHETMCRNIKPLFNFDPPATEEEVEAAALQFVRKLSGFNKPSQANQAAFDTAIEGVSQVARELIDALVTNAPPKNRELEAFKRRALAAKRFGPT